MGQTDAGGGKKKMKERGGKEGRKEEWQFVCSDPELVLVFVLRLDGRTAGGGPVAGRAGRLPAGPRPQR